VDAEGEVLDVLVQSKRDKHAAIRLMRKLLKKYAMVPDRLVTDDLRSYRAAARDLGIENHHERGKWKNNRVENSHQPTRRRELELFGRAPTMYGQQNGVAHYPFCDVPMQCGALAFPRPPRSPLLAP
jgi:transposase-like protein